ncbi:MAG TPA: alpha/beta hydrolase-fold protein, partial [Catenuloplanes sp.]
TLIFRLADRGRQLAGVRLFQHVGLPADRLDFGYDGADGGWRLEVPRPPLWRLEYLLELRHADGRTELICDPANPGRVGGAFGDKSVLQCPDYVTPSWLRLPAAAGSWRELTIPAPALRGRLRARIWSPAQATDRVLVAHDGPEYDKLGALGQYSAAMVAAGAVAPHHLVLLDPGDRDEWYSASPAYAWALVTDVLPRVDAELGTMRSAIGMGASLGALAMLHVQRRYPPAFDGLFLQSGSFFQPRFDRQESGFRRYLRMVRFTGRVVRAVDGPPVPTVLTCGRVEENLANNRDMTRTLWRQGYPAALYEVPDAHNYTGWRDAFEPHLTDLLHRVWGRA